MYLRGFVVALRCNPVYHDLEQMKNIVWMRPDQTGREWKRRMGREPEKLPCTRCFPELNCTTMTCTWRTATRSRRLCMGLPCFLTNKNRKTGQFFVEGKERDGCGDKKVNAIVARMEERITDTSLIVENRNTCDDNSQTVPLTEKQIAELRACAAK